MKNVSNWNKGEVDFVTDVQDTFCSEPHGDGEVRVGPGCSYVFKAMGPLDIKRLIIDDKLVLEKNSDTYKAVF